MTSRSDRNVHPPFSTLEALHTEVALLRAQVTSLQEANTRLVEEKRRYDRQAMVAQLHRAIGAPVLHEPTIPPDDRVRLRLRLITEEFFEMLEAVWPINGVEFEKNRLMSRIDDGVVNELLLPDFVDALADLDYVIAGTHCEFGIDGVAVFEVVHEANMRKVGPGATTRPDGKAQKPPGWQSPDIAGELERQRREAT